MIHHFPDHTRNAKTNLKISHRRFIAKSTDLELTTDSEKALEKYYDDEFRKWHVKLLFILLGCFTALYVIVAGAPGFFNWITSLSLTF